ncbi:serine/threonine-protein kinase AFC2 [Verticillium dahliae VdLs.17]|uniref:Serine/threonine-protein kinase AFC2 n=1 Tax=Verticillium dahliae (strain VdLs.17 / ATCC MYA-4575 / FGSC 10137) TaxID=498257 RepID=G2XHE4_VERDV|nr:serine/threonine-protein kinase AFC2 [Verticillium dahliae VdLs.17]EGY19370.1 serine/threonine-protein kinase AFC2 [Verticillium dahliae VdLs.17]
MSTPTTATATLPPHSHYRHNHYPYAHHTHPHASQAYQTSTPSGGPASYHRAAPTASNPILPTPSSTAASSTTTTTTTTTATRLPPIPYPAPGQIDYSTASPPDINNHAAASLSNGVAQPASNAAIPRSAAHHHTHHTHHTHHNHHHHHTSRPAPRSDAAAYNTMPTTTTHTQSSAQQPSSATRKRRRSQAPDWDKFYQNGLPKEIIVIEDSPEPGQAPNRGVKVIATAAAALNVTTTANGAAAARHVAKRRKRDDEPQPYDPIYHNKYAGSHAHTPQNHSTPSGSTISTDRTTSSAHHTTAATSLSSSNGYHEDTQAGQKRKRTTRQQLAQEAKKRELEALSDTCPSYRPPPYPPKKAPDVHVRVIQDHPYNKNSKVDDDDGHYVVVPDADLTDKFLHDLNLIHTDLKPENILLCDNTYQTFTYNRKIPSSSSTVNRQANQRRVLLDTEIRLIDFGSATFQDEYHSSVVSTRHYRAPEIILGLGWSFPCDIWSIGCILVEFFTGDALFQTHDNLEHLAMMEMVCGSRIDTHLVQSVSKMAQRSAGNPAAKYFKRSKLDYPTTDTTRASRRFVKAMKHLTEIIPSNNTFFRNFLDLLRKIFIYDPAHRITAKEALNHPWFKEPAQPDDGTEAAKIRLERTRMEQEIARLPHMHA